MTSPGDPIPTPERVPAPAPPSRAPARWRWKAALLLLLAAVGATVAAAPIFKASRDVRRARARLDTTMAALRHAGAPLTLDDLAEAPVPEAENAAPLLRQAASAMTADARPEWEFLKNPPRAVEWPLEGEEPAQLGRLLELNREALSRVRDATQRKGVAWRLQLRSPLLTMSAPDWNDQRRVAQLLWADATEAHHSGDDARLLRDVRDLTFVGRAVSRQPLLTAYLVGLGIEAMAVDRACMAAPDLRVGTSTAGDVPPDQVRALINDLLDDRPLREAISYALACERVSTIDSMNALLAGKFDPVPAPPQGSASIAWVRQARFRNLVLSSNDLLLNQLTHQIEAAAEPTWPAFAARVPETPPEVPPGASRYSLAQLMLPSLHRASKQYYRALADHRLAATALAVRVYCVEHDGRFPADLNALVPDVLKEVPRDPYARDGGPLRYVNDSDRPRVYSVGENGVDNGGVEPDPWLPRSQYVKLVDDIRHLKRQPRPKPAEPSELYPGMPPLPPGFPGVPPAPRGREGDAAAEPR